MRFERFVLLFVVAILAVACTEPADDNSHNESMVPSAQTYDPEIGPADFVDEIDNEYMPLTPGDRRIYKGTSDGEKEVVRIHVLGKTKTILGVECTVVKDEAFVGGELHERTFDWFAQDVEGNVWYFGEDTAEYENGKVTSHAGAWEAGVDGAKPGIVMPGDPEVGESYRQEYYEGEAEDMGKVIDLNARVRTRIGNFNQVLVTEDWTPLEPKVLERKYYAPEVGVVLEKIVSGGRGELRIVRFDEVIEG